VTTGILYQLYMELLNMTYWYLHANYHFLCVHATQCHNAIVFNFKVNISIEAHFNFEFYVPSGEKCKLYVLPKTHCMISGNPFRN